MRPPTARAQARRAGGVSGTSIWKPRLPDELDLGLQQDAKPLAHSSPTRGHEGQHLRGRCLAPNVLDEVRVFGREPSTSDGEAAATSFLEKLAGGHAPGL